MTISNPKVHPPVENPPEQIEAGFRRTLEDVIDVLTRLGPYCNSFEELLSMCDLATKNEAQLRLLLSEVTRPKEE